MEYTELVDIFNSMNEYGYRIWIQKNTFELKNVQNVLGILLKTIVKIRNSRFYESFYSKNCIMLPVFDKLLRYFFGKEIILYIFLKT